MKHTYQYRSHKTSGDVFAVMIRNADNVVVGVTGPLDSDDRSYEVDSEEWERGEVRPASDFDCDETDVDWFNDSADDFKLWGPDA